MRERYIARLGTWFDAGTEVKFLDDFWITIECGLFQGYHDGKLDEEVCPFSEFDISMIESDENNKTV